MIDLSKNPYLQKRSAGVSLPLSAMKGTEDWGCGDMSSLQEWIEYFSNYNIRVLQILPLWETSPREHCPYSALSAYAIDPIYISIKDVPEVQNCQAAQEIINDLKDNIENWRASQDVQFDAIKPAKYRVLWAAYEYFENVEKQARSERWKSFLQFQKKHASWLLSYAIFRTAKDLYNWSSWKTWEENLKNREIQAIKNFIVSNERQVMFFCYIQWIAQEQLEKAITFAKEKNVSLFGDIPFGVNFDSADVWANQTKFLLDAEVGAPKDALAQGGQKWGLPAYNWQAIEEQGFNFFEVERMLLLQLLDQSWKQNLYELDQLQKSVGLRGYAQKDPLIEYQKESYILYENMMTRIRDFFVDYIFRIKLPPKARTPQKMQEGRAQKQDDAPEMPVNKPIQKVGRNDLCPCGSGKKYKKCCGK